MLLKWYRFFFNNKAWLRITWKITWQQWDLLVPIVLEKRPHDLRTTLLVIMILLVGNLKSSQNPFSKKFEYIEAGVHVNSTRGTQQVTSLVAASSFLTQIEGRHPHRASLKRPGAVYWINQYPVDSYWVIQSIVIYPVDSAIQRLNNWSLKYTWDALTAMAPT